MADKEHKSLEALSDEELMHSYMLGEAQAFNELYKRHSPKIYGYLKRKLVNAAATDDVFQETFLRLHKFRTKFDSSMPFVPWLFTISRNAMIDYQRKQARISKETQEQEVEQASPMWGESAPAMAIYNHLESLTEREKEILVLHIQDGFSFNQIGSWLKISPANARKLSSRAIQKLRALWK